MIFITGCARSGTSLTAKILQAHGCNLGPANRVNQLYENVSIRENILKPYLSRLGADPLGQNKLPNIYHLPPIPELRERVLNYLPGEEPRAYKDAKLSLVFPAFADAFPDAKWIIVRRDRQKIIESCLRTPFMRAWDKPDKWDKWAKAHERRFALMRADLDTLEVWPDWFIKEPQAFVSVTEFLGLLFDFAATENAINPRLWHAD